MKLFKKYFLVFTIVFINCSVFAAEGQLTTDSAGIEQKKKKALNYLKVFESIKNPDIVELITAAHIYRLLGNEDRALKLYKKVINHKDFNKQKMSIVYFYLPDLYQKKYDKNPTKKYFDTRMKYFDLYLKNFSIDFAADYWEQIKIPELAQGRNVVKHLQVLDKQRTESRRRRADVTGSYNFGLDYIDIDNYLNNTSYNRGSTFKFGFLGTGKLFEKQFTGIANINYNNKKQQKKIDFETLRFEFLGDTISYMLGQFYPQYSEFTLSNQKIEGANLNYKNKKINTDIFTGISNQYEKITELNGSAEYQQYLYGLRSGYSFTKDSVLNFTLFQAQDDKSSIDTGTPSSGPVKNTVYSLGYTGLIPIGWFKGTRTNPPGISGRNTSDAGKSAGSSENDIHFSVEYSKSFLDKNKSSSDEDKENDCAFRTSLSYNLLKNLNTSLQYKRFGKKYYSAGYTALNSSEVGYKGILFNYEFTQPQYSVTGDYEDYKEYSYDTSGIGTRYRTLNNTLKHKYTKTTTVTLTAYLKDTQKDDKSLYSFKQTYKLRVAGKIKTASISGQVSLAKTNDKTEANSDVTTKGFSANFRDNYLKNNLVVTAFILGNITELNTGDIKFFMVNGNINGKLIPRKLSLISNISFKLNSSSTELSRTYTNSVNLKYYLTLQKYIDFILANDRKTNTTTNYNVFETEIKYSLKI